jgi:uncharacterized protein (TIGR02444 family)
MARILADLQQNPASGIFMSSLLPIEISLWDFSLHHYARAGVSDICLRLQDESGINVNLLFWAWWLGHRGQALDSELLLQARCSIHDWDQHYVMPLRQLRKQMKANFGTDNQAIEAVRTHIKHAELSAEKHVQQLLESMSGQIPLVPTKDARQLMEENLLLYMGAMAINEERSRALLAQID